MVSLAKGETVPGLIGKFRQSGLVEFAEPDYLRFLNAVDPRPSLADKCVTGGRLNLRKALSPPVQLTSLSVTGTLPYQLRVSAGPNRSCVIESSTNLTNRLPIHTNTDSVAGTFDYTDTASTNAPRYFFRAVSTL